MTNPSPTPAPLMLSVSGLRGIVNATMTDDVVRRFATVLARQCSPNKPDGQPLIVVGRDSRPSGEQFAQQACAALTAAGCRVIDLGIVATPTVAVAIEHHHADAGFIITASHNPIQWNGVKVLNDQAHAPAAHQAQQLIDAFRALKLDDAPTADPDRMQRDTEATQRHVDKITRLLDIGAIAQRKFRVVVDSIHGAGGDGAALLLRSLGAEIIHLNAPANGDFVHPPEPTAEHLTDLCEQVKDHNADVGFAQDPDADRLAIVDENGRYIGEEYTLVLCAQQVLSRLHNAAETALVANLSSSRMIDDVAQRFGATMHRASVGEANVVEAMKRRDAVIGGEGNGGVIWPEICHVRDSLSGIGLVLSLMAATDQPLSVIVDAQSSYHILKSKIDLPQREAADAVLSRLRHQFADETLDEQDGLRIDIASQRAWLHVRPSNTEPILRLIAEAPTLEVAQALLQTARAAADASAN